MPLLDDLAARLRSTPEAPWIFYIDRAGVHAGWAWRSWAQVVDQAARMGELLVDAPDPLPVEDRRHPDTVAAVLAALATGRAPAPTRSAAFKPPPVRSRLDDWTPTPLPPAPDPAATRPPWEHAADTLDAAFPPTGKRDILAVSPQVGWDARLAALTWTARVGAAWVLIEDGDFEGEFLSATLWTRPTLLMASGDELGLLATALRQGSHRRHHRLRAVLNMDDAPDEICDAPRWRELGVAVPAYSSQVSNARVS